MIEAAVVSALVGTVSMGTAITIGSIVSGVVMSSLTSMVLGGITSALAPKPKGVQGGGELVNQPGTVAVRQSDLTHTHVYGIARAVRGYAHIVSTNTNKDLHMIVMLCQGELTAINEIWVNDYAIPDDFIGVDGSVLGGRYQGKMKIYRHLGGIAQAADSYAVANIPEWTTNHRLQGIAYLYVIMNKDQDVYPTGVPNVSAIVDGQALYDPRTSTSQFSTNIALMAYDFIKSSEYGFAAVDADINTANIIAQANICDEMVAVTSEPFEAIAATSSNNTITLIGDLLALQMGDRVQVTTTGTLPSGISALTNYYVIPYQIKTTPRIMLATSLANAMARIPVDITTDGTGVITITKNAEPRYHGGGVFDTESDLRSTLADIVNGMAGRAVHVAGAWTLLAGAYRSPVLEFTRDDVRGAGFQYRNQLSMSDSFNIVKGIFRSQVTAWQDTDYPSAKYSTFIVEDMGIESQRELDLPFVSRPTTAQRIAKIELFKARQEIVVSADFSAKAMQVQCGDTIQLTEPRYGWSQKEFEVTSFGFDVANGVIVCKLSLRETAAAIYDWASGEAIGYDPAPNTSLTNPFSVSAPSGVSYNSRFIETSGGDSIYTLQLEWDEHPDAFVAQYGDFEIQFKLSAESSWLPGFFVDGSLVQTDVVTASTGVEYDLRIRARNNLGVRSAWSTIEAASVGSSGGVTVSLDYGLVGDSPVTLEDWGSVADSPVVLEDYEFVV